MRGFALTETLVALAITGLIVTALLWLQVDYVALARRAVAQGRPSPDVASLQQMARGFDNCAAPHAVLARSDLYGLALREGEAETPVMGLPAKAQLRAVSALGPDGKPRGGWSSASIERGGTTVAVVAQRCDLPEWCSYDLAKGQCSGN